MLCTVGSRLRLAERSCRAEEETTGVQGGGNMKVWLALAMASASLCVLGCAETNPSGQAAPSAGVPTQPSGSSPESSAGGKEGPGSLSHAEDEQFCASHECIANFPNGHGEVVECSDGEWSHSGGVAGACADHGGVRGGETSTSPGKSEVPEHHSGEPSGGGNEGPGSPSHTEDTQFCESHTCIGNFSNGNGAVVECNDGEWSHSGGLSGACSHHGGENASSASSGEPSGPESSTSSASDPLEALNKYWSDIRDHGFATAYAYLTPGAAAGKTESQFIASEEEAGIKNAQFHGKVSESTGSTATIAVESLITEDAQFGCRRWSGRYTLTNENGGWRIQRADLTPRSC